MCFPGPSSEKVTAFSTFFYFFNCKNSFSETLNELNYKSTGLNEGYASSSGKACNCTCYVLARECNSRVKFIYVMQRFILLVSKATELKSQQCIFIGKFPSCELMEISNIAISWYTFLSDKDSRSNIRNIFR